MDCIQAQSANSGEQKGEQNDERHWWQNITERLYVILFGVYMFGVSMSVPFVQKLVVDRFCEEKFNRETCYGHRNNSIENAIQTDAAQFLLLKLLIVQLPPVLLAFTLGHWSDVHGRKFLMLIAIIGQMMSFFIYLLICLFDEWPISIQLLASVPTGLTGSSISFTLGFFGYVKDLNCNQRLSTEISIAEGIAMIGMQVGPVIGTQLYNAYGYPAVFGTSIFIMAISFLSVLLVVNEAKQRPKCHWTTALKDLFKFQFFLDSLKAVVKNRSGNIRAYIISVNIAFLIIHFGISAILHIKYLFTRLVAGWSIDLYNYYHVMTTGCNAIGLLMLLPILTNRVHMNDADISVIGLVFGMAYYISTAFSTTTTALFTVSLFLIPSVLVLVTTKSFVAKCVSSAEIGKLLAFHSVLQSITNNVATTTAIQIYVETMLYLPGAIFFICGIILIIPMFIFIWISIDLKKNKLVLEQERDAQLKEDVKEEITVEQTIMTVHL